MTDHIHTYPNPPDELDRVRGIARCQIPGCDDVVDLVIGQLGPPGSIHVNRTEGSFTVDPTTRRITKRTSPLLAPTSIPANRGFTPLPEYKNYVGMRISREDWSWLLARSVETGTHIDRLGEELLAAAIDAARSESAVPAGAAS